MNLSIVYQGSFSHVKTKQQKMRLIQNILFLKENNIDCEIIISSWEGEKLDYLNKVADNIIYNKDPGPLPSLKFDGKLNNINRLIVSSSAGIRAARGKYIVKLRSDLEFYLTDIVDFYENQCRLYENIPPSVYSKKIICCNLFTIDPKLAERMPYHVSDWIQIGTSYDIVKFWDIELYGLSDALYYNFNKHAKNSNALEKAFQSKFAVEQYITVSAARNFGHNIQLNYHNDFSSQVIKDYYEFLVSNYIINDISTMRLINDKYKDLNASLFFKLTCISESRYKKMHDYSLRKKNIDFNNSILSVIFRFIFFIKNTKKNFKSFFKLLKVIF